MAPAATITGRPLTVTTALDGGASAGKKKFVARQFQSDEAISQLFRGSLDVSAERSFQFTFDQILGTPVLVELAASQGTRFFHGICRRIMQSGSDADSNHFRFEIVPQAWLLTKKAQSRIFQQISVPDILKQVFADLQPAPSYELGQFEPRDYCVQYRETDWSFAARLMEEEGINFFFRHTEKGHQLVVANSPGSHKDVPFAPKVTFKSASTTTAREEFITDFAKAQEIVPGKVTLWDQNFELPHKHLEADQQVQETVQIGQASHKIRFGLNGKLEVYDYPGEYSERFDGVGPGGVDRPADLQKIFTDNKRTAGIRMEQEAARAIECRGTSTCRQLVPGFKFTLTTPPGDSFSRGLQADGEYLITSLSQTAALPNGVRSGGDQSMNYANLFTAIPIGLPFRPPRITPKPIVPGTQTAVVTGPKGEEIFTDKFGRVKVQFHWDRQGKYDADSSCWLRFSTSWAGRRWGAVHIPRVGQEVIVDFLEGDPDRPIIVGCVFNADQMPPYKLPENRTRSGVKSNTSPGGKGFNEIRFEDKKGHEQVFIHAEGNHDLRVKGSSMTSVGGSAHLTVGGEKDGKQTGDIKQRVFHDLHQRVGNDQVTFIEGDRQETVINNIIEEVMLGGRFTEIRNGDSVQNLKSLFVTSDSDLVMKAPNIYLNASSMIQMNVGGNLVTIDATGVTVFGTLTKVNCPGTIARPVPPTPPTPPVTGPKAGSTTRMPDDPAPADNAVSGSKSSPD